MTAKTTKGRDLPHIDAHEKVRFVLVHGDRKLELFNYCKHTHNMADGIITIYLKYAEPSDESDEEKEIDRLRKENKRLMKEVADYRQHFTRFYP